MSNNILSPAYSCVKHNTLSTLVLNIHLFKFPLLTCCSHIIPFMFILQCRKRLKQLKYLTKRARYVETSIDPIVFKSVLVSNCAILLPFLTISSTWLRLSLSGYRFMVLNTTFNNYISVISWWSVLLVEKTGVPGENHWPVASHW